ncbi:short-chain dehydrogenase/reductase SDR [Candidatus Koribacter versatilis Ellin345]|uniref:Short-chain dehydrogenase/reductase SDR n=1 Tax=Koribacter versatilis (strain Ellin345) TaxID=204669 RepID=Q1IV84_KORVE|nr:SDR family NAD(P)-dependent oxidoreductase [Candidatus Koribacter versatilis]ABF39216.1 short-chain dehydrogenase/reductase SDR [Candidatus Koribacter versatilis Ellin345]
MRFDGKTALVAGGTGGLGKAVSLALMAEGARVVVTYIIPEEFNALRTAAADRQIEGHHIDVTDETATQNLVADIIGKYGRLDFLINTIGGYAGGIKLWELETKTFEKMFTLNLRAGYSLARAVIPAMLKQKSGAIVNIAAKAAVDHAGGASAYASSKAAALAMMDSLAEDLRGTGVRVNSILPSIIDTAANRHAMPGADYSKWPKPEDIAKVILFLLSDDGKVIHGAAVPVYGAL